MGYLCWIGYFVSVPVGALAYIVGSYKDKGTVAVLERKLKESTADQQLLLGKYEALTASCTAITAHSHEIDARLADSEMAYAKIHKECEQYKRELSILRLNEAKPTKRNAKKPN